MAKATFPAQSPSVAETAKPADADGFVASDHRNVGSALFQGDISPLRPRANSPATLKVNVVKAEIEGFFRMVYGNSKHVTFAGGDSPTFSAPSSNPRIDLLYLDVSSSTAGTLTVVTGTEAASPSEPELPSLSAAIPICYVYNRVGQTAIVNFEDSGANPTQGYIYRDVRPWVSAGGGVAFGGSTPANVQLGGSGSAGSATTASKSDHAHPQNLIGARGVAPDTSVADSTATALVLSASTDFDTDSMYNAGQNTRLTVNTAGKYLLIGQIEWQTNASGMRAIYLRINGAVHPRGLSRILGNSSVYLVSSVAIVVNLSVGDYIELVVSQTSGGALTVYNEDGCNYLTAIKIG